MNDNTLTETPAASAARLATKTDAQLAHALGVTPNCEWHNRLLAEVERRAS